MTIHALVEIYTLGILLEHCRAISRLCSMAGSAGWRDSSAPIPAFGACREGWARTTHCTEVPWVPQPHISREEAGEVLTSSPCRFWLLLTSRCSLGSQRSYKIET